MRRYFPDLESFSASAPNADVIPVYRQLLGDRLTRSASLKCSGAMPMRSCWRACGRGEGRARYSFTATAPSLVYQVSEGNASILPGGSRLSETARHFKTADPLVDLQHLLPRRRYKQDPHLPTFTGGLVGRTGTRQWWQRVGTLHDQEIGGHAGQSGQGDGHKRVSGSTVRRPV